MSHSKNGANKPGNRNLPSWVSSRDNESESPEKKPNGDGEGEERKEGQKPTQGKGRGSSKNSGASSSGTTNVSKLLEGVVFVLSGFVNPERSILRSQALEMGAEYQPDWSSECTLLVCAFSNTPKFRQVEADCGTIVSKEWISECYTQKKLVDIESYLMHAGKPWRKSSVSQDNRHDQRLSRPSRSKKQDGDSPSKPTASATLKHVKAADSVRECFSPSEVKKWAVNDLKKTISWLESQEEKPDPDEIKQIAAEGILTCLQDAIASLEQKQDVQQITEQWNFIPHVVEELAKLESTGNNSVAISKEDLCRQAMDCKRIYEVELHNLDDDSSRKKKRKTGRREKDKGETEALCSGAAVYDSDETLEMTEEEIDLAYNTIASKISNTE
ncbi:putative BRCT domain-containing protein [Rosa chinensis]|uniref:Putative BRCT domain-containing protein n=1 Tax=Rosa chinensis TaxID=74649 RepID=A0A2P6RWL3_ROSCH|nr:DNA-repair protein XRCC1 [Rosa chinensis]XP_024182849.1 DNA-repair protein XRCC1 [Rosa chinensis]PRQ50817.1 putative BRCT domain-containing protein [Rosa chinensis]